MCYFVLQTFVTQTVSRDMRAASDDTHQMIVRSVLEIEQSFQTVSALFGNSDRLNDPELVSRFRTLSVSGRLFDELLWVRLNPQGQVISVTPIFGKTIDGLHYSKDQKDPNGPLVTSVVRFMTHAKSSMVLLHDVPGTQYVADTPSPLIVSRPFALARIVHQNGEFHGVLIGLSRISRMIDPEWLKGRDRVERITVRVKEDGSRLYHMDRRPVGLQGERDAIYGSTYPLTFQGAPLEIQIDLNKGQTYVLLERTPLLLMSFGIMLTFLGTLFVRNNQRHSRKLMTMNRMLAQKNMELNNQILERERISQALTKTERDNRAIVDSVSDIIFEVDPEGEILFLNKAWHKVTGFSIERGLKRNLFDLLHPQDQDEQRQAFADLVQGLRGAYRSFTRMRTADGSFRSVELAVSMLRHDESGQMHVVGTLTDVEERRRAERALGEAEKKYRSIWENAAAGLYQMTPGGQILTANPAMAKILGYASTEDLLREVKDAHRQLYVNQRERLQFIRELEAQGTLSNVEMQVVRRGGDVIWVSENARVVRDEEDNIMYFEGAIEETTQRKEAEIKLRHAKIQSDLANRAKTEFLANMSHELRTPLNAIIGFSEIIKNEVFGTVGQQAYKDYVSDIHESGKHLLAIINDILDISRIEVGERQINEGVVNLKKVTNSCLQLMAGKIDANEMTVDNCVGDDIPSLIGEELAIKQMLMNLLSNAIKFTPAGGRVTISAARERTGDLRLSVTDTGIGLDEAEIEKALSPFGQVDNSLSRSGSGTGLGLTLVDSLIKLHGGRLELFSQKGIGTTVSLIFPGNRIAVI